MNETIAISKAALVKLVDAVLFPNPDDPGVRGPWGPFGPGGPVTHWSLRNLAWVMLNPQPLPPREDPEPEPWRAVLLARAMIEQAVTQMQLGELVAGPGQGERIRESVAMRVKEFVDEVCGTHPRKWPWPWPSALGSGESRPIELLVIGAQFHKAAELESPLKSTFDHAADRLIETGLKRL
jgi:hypothetical protein